MKTEIALAVETRAPKTKLAILRKSGKIPAVYYGKKQPSTPVAVKTADFLKVLRKAGESTVVTLKTGSGDLESLIYAVDRDPVSGVPRHADFYVFEKGQKIKVKIPLEFSGVAPAVKDLGGVLVKVLREVEVEAAPKNLPHALSVRIEKLLDFRSQILARDIALPEGVSLVENPEEVVASVYEPKEEVVEEALPDLSAIEVEKKGKEAKEGDTAMGETPAGEKTPPAPAEKEKAGKK